MCVNETRSNVTTCGASLKTVFQARKKARLFISRAPRVVTQGCASCLSRDPYRFATWLRHKSASSRESFSPD